MLYTLLDIFLLPIKFLRLEIHILDLSRNFLCVNAIESFMVYSKNKIERLVYFLIHPNHPFILTLIPQRKIYTPSRSPIDG